MLPPTGLIPWFSKTEGNTYATLLHHPLLFGENQRNAQEVAVLCGGHGAVSTRSGLLSAGVGVRWGVAGSLSNGVSAQSGRVSIMCGGASSWTSKIGRAHV